MASDATTSRKVATAIKATATVEPTIEELRQLARIDFWCFVELLFPQLHSGQKIVYAPYLELIASALMGVASDKTRRLIINLPPRHMKSILTSVLYPAWRLGTTPTLKFICVSYSDTLAHDLSNLTRTVMQSPQYKSIFPKTVLDKKAVDYIRTTTGGYRFATAVGSDITGFGADEIIIDDPIEPQDALSETAKQRLRDWVNSSVLTRFNNFNRGKLILVMHRLAPDDLSQTFEASAGLILKLPLIAEVRESYEAGGFRFHRNPGDPLNPDRMGTQQIEELKTSFPPMCSPLSINNGLRSAVQACSLSRNFGGMIVRGLVDFSS